jgi:putative Flp pilus-assembly TadE/G-like protein
MMQKLLRRQEHPRGGERGAVLVLVAVTLPVIIFFVAFGIEVGHWFDYSRNLQNRADAAALAAAQQFGNLCINSPTDPTASPENKIGEMAQLFSGPQGSSSELPYLYSGTGSPLDTQGPLAQFWAHASAAPPGGLGLPVQYQNLPNLSVSNGTNGANYHVLLNANNYASSGGTNFAIGDFCHGDPKLDATDSECYGQTPTQGTQLAIDCAAGPMVDVKVTQSDVPQFFPIFGFRPNISAHARVAVQSLAVASQLLPLAVGDAAYVPCVQVKFFPAGSSTPSTTINLALNKPATKAAGNPVWDNTNDGSGSGDAVAIPSTGTGYAYMQAVLYSEDTSGPMKGHCNSTAPHDPITYPLSSSGKATSDGILVLGSYPTPSLGTLGPGALPRIDTGGVTLSDGTGNPDQYFSSIGDYSINVTAHVAFSSTAGATQVWAVDMTTGQKLQLTPSGSPNTWTGSGLTGTALSGQHPICIQVNQANGIPSSQKSACKGSAANGDYSLGVQQETFAACSEATSSCNNDESGPIIQAQIGQLTQPGSGLPPIIDWSARAFPENTNPTLLVSLELQGLSNAAPGDRCQPSGQCTVLRLDNAGNGNGAIDCGEGNGGGGGGNGIYATMLYGCPVFGQSPAPPAVSCQNNGSQNYCGMWTATPDGTCNNLISRPAGAVNCVNTNNGGANVPSCVAALIQTGATVDSTNCNLKGASTGCAVDHWLQGDGIPTGDPRVMSTFVVFAGDIINANGNTPVPIRQIAAFYVTGWKFTGGGGQVSCPAGGNPTQANEPAPPSAASANNAIWGHWITYTVVGGGGSGQTCDFQSFGECTPVLTR